MPQFSDDLFLGSAATYMGTNANNPLNDPSEMSVGVGPLGRIYVWDLVPLTLQTNNISTAATYTGGGNATLAAGTGTTAVTRQDGVSVIQLDCPRAVSITIGTGTITDRAVTVTGFDFYGQRMSEVIQTGTTQSTTINGKKAFFQIASVNVANTVGGTLAVGTADIFGCPVRVTNLGYVGTLAWNNALARAAGTFTAADTATATTTTGDVRGTYAPANAADGSKRLVVGVLLPALAVGPNATRIGALGVNQNLAS
jgi:hypothetical protein